MEKLTEKLKEKLAYEILSLLKGHGLEGDVWIYFNNKCLGANGEITCNIRAGERFKYGNDDTISMAFEGAFYEVINYLHPSLSDEVLPKLNKLLGSYGLFYEQGEHWNLAAYYIKPDPPDETAAEAKEGESPDNPIFIRKSGCPAELEPIRAEWETRQNDYGDGGSCVVGAGFRFEFQGLYYRMRPQGRTQGSVSWEESVEDIRQMLFDAGFVNITFDCGNMN